jgi:hypothetical protein
MYVREAARQALPGVIVVVGEKPGQSASRSSVLHRAIEEGNDERVPPSVRTAEGSADH